jgi:hypothetical protein
MRRRHIKLAASENEMPNGARDNLDEMYAKQQLLTDEATHLEDERDGLDPDGPDANRHYILELQIAALREESTRISSRISDVLERDLQR